MKADVALRLIRRLIILNETSAFIECKITALRLKFLSV